MTKFRIGDRVRLKSDLNWTHVNSVRRAREGTIGTVQSIHNHSTGEPRVAVKWSDDNEIVWTWENDLILDTVPIAFGGDPATIRAKALKEASELQTRLRDESRKLLKQENDIATKRKEIEKKLTDAGKLVNDLSITENEFKVEGIHVGMKVKFWNGFDSSVNRGINLPNEGRVEKIDKRTAESSLIYLIRQDRDGTKQAGDGFWRYGEQLEVIR